MQADIRTQRFLEFLARVVAAGRIHGLCDPVKLNGIMNASGITSQLSTPTARIVSRRLSPYGWKLFLPFHLLVVVSLYLTFQYDLFMNLRYSIFVWVLVSGFGIAIGYHRLLSHKAFSTSKLITRILAFLGCLAGQESPFFWTAVHRGLHHPHSDSEKDPHSPIHGFWWSVFGWQLFFQRSDFDGRSARDVLSDPFLRFLSVHYYKVYWGTLLVLFLISWEFAVSAIVPALVVCLHQENIINSVCHTRRMGYRNFETKDNSVNNYFLGVLCWGQGFHNNHHKYPSRYDYGVKTWEIDLTKYLIRLLQSKGAS